jgi:hypothetical protein
MQYRKQGRKGGKSIHPSTKRMLSEGRRIEAGVFDIAR